MITRRVRVAMLCAGVAGAILILSGDIRVNAQESNRAEDAAGHAGRQKDSYRQGIGKAS